MKMLPNRANYLTSIMAGLVTDIGIIIGNAIKIFFSINNEDGFILLLVIGTVFFLFHVLFSLLELNILSVR
jgi:hypothetical protein